MCKDRAKFAKNFKRLLDSATIAQLGRLVFLQEQLGYGMFVHHAGPEWLVTVFGIARASQNAAVDPQGHPECLVGPRTKPRIFEIVYTRSLHAAQT
jgi:hypothetical protein